ncbi:RagB/SusD family nutrient uptake outer membrane protein [Chitinophaga polysaccharea]|uniref:RagB/SusD family nutrient uptake outer membrane protein n=1 Tax=Chitinophaga polysaccharea TaxID=1293035 RepID=UPI00115C018D|nr:RagB/SusD family nutrient uptake outer membrane protein [Chitinophaga polysaccharea]
MRYKKIIRGILPVCLVIVTACGKKLLDIKPVSLSTDAVFADAIAAGAFMNNIYNLVPSGYSGTWAGMGISYLDVLMLAQATDEAVSSSAASRANQLAIGNFNAESTNLNYMWATMYMGIRQTNIFLENVAKLPEGESKSVLTGEAYFLRALFYQELLRLYGGGPEQLGVPLILHVQQVGGDVFTDRSPYMTCVDSIVADLDKAALLLPDRSAVISGRPSKGAAMAYKTRLLLYAASPFNNPARERKRWENAANAAKKVMQLTDGYTLHNDYQRIFLDKTNKELIFYREYSINGKPVSMLDLFTQPTGYGGRGDCAPTADLVNAYEMQNGRPITDPASGYNPAKPYEGRDPRFYASILYNGAPWAGRAVETFDGGKDKLLTTSTQTGYYLKKFLDPVYFSSGNTRTLPYSFQPYILFRYTEILLDYAEAQWQLGNIGESLQYVNKVRERSGMPPIAESDYTWERYVNERRVEMAFEDQRFFDLRRWNIAATILSGPVHGTRIVRQPDGSFRYQQTEVGQRVFRAPQMYRMPVPLDEVKKIQTVIPRFQQSPGW